MQNIPITDKESLFLLHAFKAFRRDIDTLTLSIAKEKDKRNAQINAKWIAWLRENLEQLQEKMFGNMEVLETNLLDLFYLETNHQQSVQSVQS